MARLQGSIGLLVHLIFFQSNSVAVPQGFVASPTNRDTIVAVPVVPAAVVGVEGVEDKSMG